MFSESPGWDVVDECKPRALAIIIKQRLPLALQVVCMQLCALNVTIVVSIEAVLIFNCALEVTFVVSILSAALT